jgi:hypothetical protein
MVDSFYGDVAGGEAELLGCSPEIGAAQNNDERRRPELGLGQPCGEERNRVGEREIQGGRERERWRGVFIPSSRGSAAASISSPDRRQE